MAIPYPFLYSPHHCPWYTYESVETTTKSSDELGDVFLALCNREQDVSFIFLRCADFSQYVVFGFPTFTRESMYNFLNIVLTLIVILCFNYQVLGITEMLNLCNPLLYKLISKFTKICTVQQTYLNKRMALEKQAILALCASTLTLIVFGSIYTFGALTPYIASYLYYKGDETQSTSLSILFTMTILMVNVGTAIANTFLTNVSNRILCIAAIIAMSLSVFAASFMETFAGFVAFYGVGYGLSIGIGYFPPLKNCYLHLPKRKGLCAGICMSGFGLSSAIFNYIILQLINPKNILIDKSTKRYPLEVAQNLPFTLRILSIVYIAAGLLGAFFVLPPKQTKDSKNYILLSQQSGSESIVKPKQQKTTTQNSSFIQMMKIFVQKKAHWVAIQYICIAPFGMFTAFNYKRIAFDRNPYFLENDHLVTIIGSVGIICNGLFRSGWGYLFDHVTYRKIIFAINILLMIFCGLILLAVQNVVAYFFIIPLTYLAYGGLYALLPTQTVRMLGPVVGGKLFWVMFSGFSGAAVVQFVIQYIFLTPERGLDGYFICLGIFFGLQIIGFFIGLFLKLDSEDQDMILVKKDQKDVMSVESTKIVQ